MKFIRKECPFCKSVETDFIKNENSTCILKCKNCKLIFLNSQLGEEEKIEYVEERYSQSIDFSTIKDVNIKKFKSELKLISEQIPKH